MLGFNASRKAFLPAISCPELSPLVTLDARQGI